MCLLPSKISQKFRWAIHPVCDVVLNSAILRKVQFILLMEEADICILYEVILPYHH